MMLPTPLMCAVVILAASVRIAHGFAPSVSILPSSSAAAASVGSSVRRRRPLPARRNDDDRVDDRRRRGRGSDPSASSDDAAAVVSRDRFLVSAASAMATSVLPLVAILTTTTFAVAPPSNALVKGNAPPPKKRPADDGGGEQDRQPPKCRNVEECQETAEREETLRAQREAALAASGPKPRIAPGGTKYLDVVEEAGSPPPAATAAVAKIGDVADVHYRVLKIGKRSYDGLSGEGTVVFSRGYALEDDERVPGDRSFRFAIGDDRIIKALNDAVPGMAVGGTRRISVTPQSGWEKNTRLCDGGPGGSGAGGDLKTDYVVVPTATMVEQEACFDKTKLPFPATYAQERRMAQRFDQSLILEVRLVNLS